jgi:hypothetical protein
MPLGAAKVIGFPVKDDTIRNKVEMIISSTDTLVAQL